MKKIRISKKIAGEAYPSFIIAEAGVNHNGRLELAKKLIDAAKSAGVDAVKFQTYKTEALVSAYAPKAEYQKRKNIEKTQFEMLKSLELSESQFLHLFNYCKRKKIVFLSTPFDSESAGFLYRLGVPAFKIGSGDLNNIPLLVQISKYKKPIILSTGMSTLQEVKEAVEVVYSAGNKKLILLHCTSNYPTKINDVNLRAMHTLENKFNVPVGYSDHTEGILIPVIAVAMGACIIEKHFTLDRNLPGPDHRTSLEPDELRVMVRAIRDTEKALGSRIKNPTKEEEEIKKAARKSVVALVDISKDTPITKEMLILKRPGTGLAPKYLNKIIGEKPKKDIKKDSLISLSNLY